MRVALLFPTFWPEVRRGSERLIHDLGVSLARRGREVTLLTSHPAPATEVVEDGIRVIRSRRLSEGWLGRKYELHLGNVPNVIRRLLEGDFDLAHACYQTDAWAAVKARRLGGPPVVFSIHGIPIREYLVGRRYRVEMLRSAIEGAAATTVLSEAAADAVRRYLLADPRVLPGGVLLDRFAFDGPRAEVPTIICAASLGDPFKRAEVLFAAFETLRRSRPEARLVLVRSRDPHLSWAISEPPVGTEWIDGDRTEELARAYASAWASVLPSVGEAFGLVLLESLAAGTPVVASRSGGMPEIVTNDRVGRLFEPDDPRDLARALAEALELGARPDTAEACRSHAAEWDWSRIVLRYEELYASVLDGASRDRG